MLAVGRVGNRVLPVKITDVFRQGVKPLWKMTLANGSSITTTQNHRHLTTQGWRRLDELVVGDEIATMGDGEWDSTPQSEFIGGRDWVRRHDCANGGRTKRWDKGRPIESSPIIAIEYVGEAMTYDITVDSDDHSWVANESIITHNSHAAGYGVVAYWTAYLKANHPTEYMAALLTSVGDNRERAAIYLAECRKLGIKVLPPDVNGSQLTFTAAGADIRFGLGAIRNVGGNVVDAIVATRTGKGRFTDFNDFLTKVPPAVSNKRVIESLAKAGAFDSLGHERRALVMVHAQAIDAINDVKRHEAHGQDTLFAALDEPGGETCLSAVPLPAGEWDRSTLLAFEREMLGLYVSGHPLDGAEQILADNRDTSIADLLDSDRTDGHVRISGIIAGVDRRVTRKGDPWAIVTVEDHHGALECLFFPAAYALYAETVTEDLVVSVSGRVSTRDEAITLYAESLTVLDTTLGTGTGPPVVISIGAHRVNEDLVGGLRRILETHPGNTPVHVRMLAPEPGQSSVLLSVNFQVDVSPAFMGDVKSLLGAGAIARDA